jgi:hypothetical protein
MNVGMEKMVTTCEKREMRKSLSERDKSSHTLDFLCTMQYAVVGYDMVRYSVDHGNFKGTEEKFEGTCSLITNSSVFAIFQSSL